MQFWIFTFDHLKKKYILLQRKRLTKSLLSPAFHFSPVFARFSSLIRRYPRRNHFHRV